MKNLNLNKIVGVNPSDNTEKQGFSCCSKVNLKKIDYLQSKNQMTACKILNIHIMTKCFFANIITIVFLDYLNSEDPLKFLSPNLKANKQYDKHWMAYVSKFTEISGLGHLPSSAPILIHTLKILKTRTHIKNIFTYYDVKINKKVTFAIYNCTYVLYRLQSFGEITYYYDTDEIFREISYRLHHNIWYFIPNERIRIRIIFHNLKIHDNYRSCHQNITVCTSNSTTYAKQIICKNDALVLCGDYSMFHFYSQHRKVYFNLYYSTNPLFKLDVSFDIISNNIIHNNNLQSKVDNRYQYFYNIQVIQTLLQVFYIKVSKFQQINIKFNFSSKCTVYDGPGYLSKSYIISDKYSKFLTSSFQCLIKVISSNLKTDIDLQHSVYTYISFTRYTQTLILSDKEQKYYTYNSFENKSNFHKKLIFESGKNTHLSIKISKFHYIALHEDFNCKYGGVSMFDFILGNMEETRSDCTTRLDDQFNLQPLNSKNNKTLVVIYSYYQYSNISISINITVIDCHLVKITLCDMDRVCYANAKSCSSFLENETITIHGEPISRDSFKITFQPKGEHCVKVQLETNPFSYLTPFPNLQRKIQRLCTTMFYVKVSRDSYVYQYDMSGYFSNIDSLWSHWQKFYAFNTPYKYDPIHNISVTHWVNGTKKILKNSPGRSNDAFILLDAPKGLNLAFTASLLEKMPSHKDSVLFSIFITKWISWVDLYFRKTNLLPENENKIILNTLNHFANKILGHKILKISMNQKDIEENQTEFQLTIKTQVKACKSCCLWSSYSCNLW